MNDRAEALTFQGEPADGFLIGKAASLADWRFRKEQREGAGGAPDFATLVNRLRAAKWYAETKRDPAKVVVLLERVKKRNKRADVKAQILARQQQRRAEAREKLLRAVWGCVECGATWCLVPWVKRLQAADFCSQACQKRHLRRTNAAARDRMNELRMARYYARKGQP